MTAGRQLHPWALRVSIDKYLAYFYELFLTKTS